MITIALSQPLRVGERTLTELRLREEVTAGDLWDLTPVDIDESYKPRLNTLTLGEALILAGKLADPPLGAATMRGLGALDANQVYLAVLPLALTGQAAGGSPSASSSSTEASPRPS